MHNGVFYGVLTVAIIIVIIIVLVLRNKRKWDNEGILAEATITEVKKEEFINDEGFKQVVITYFLTYRNERGETIDTKLVDVEEKLEKGQKVMIKYLDSNPKKVILSK